MPLYMSTVEYHLENSVKNVGFDEVRQVVITTVRGQLRYDRSVLRAVWGILGSIQ